MNRAKNFIVFTFLLAFAVCVSAQSNSYPNELQGYQLFGKGKIIKLKPGISTKKDVIKTFGEDCDSLKGCKFDENWNIVLFYFDPITARFKDSADGERVKYKPKPKYYGKIQTIQFRAIKRISFKKTLLTKNFKTDAVEVSRAFFSSDQSGFLSSIIYYDSYGLHYFVCQSEDDNYFRKGDLVYITYELSEREQSLIFVKSE